MDYFITLEKEVMSEVAASIEATIINYMIYVAPFTGSVD